MAKINWLARRDNIRKVFLEAADLAYALSVAEYQVQQAKTMKEEDKAEARADRLHNQLVRAMVKLDRYGVDLTVY